MSIKLEHSLAMVIPNIEYYLEKLAEDKSFTEMHLLYVDICKTSNLYLIATCVERHLQFADFEYQNALKYVSVDVLSKQPFEYFSNHACVDYEKIYRRFVEADSLALIDICNTVYNSLSLTAFELIRYSKSIGVLERLIHFVKDGWSSKVFYEVYQTGSIELLKYYNDQMRGFDDLVFKLSSFTDIIGPNITIKYIYQVTSDNLMVNIGGWLDNMRDAIYFLEDPVTCLNDMYKHGAFIDYTPSVYLDIKCGGDNGVVDIYSWFIKHNFIHPPTCMKVAATSKRIIDALVTANAFDIMQPSDFDEFIAYCNLECYNHLLSSANHVGVQHKIKRRLEEVLSTLLQSTYKPHFSVNENFINWPLIMSINTRYRRGFGYESETVLVDNGLLYDIIQRLEIYDILYVIERRTDVPFKLISNLLNADNKRVCKYFRNHFDSK